MLAGAGMGKSHIAGRVEQTLGDSWEVTWIVGQRLLVDTDFAVIENLIISGAESCDAWDRSTIVGVVQLLHEYVQAKTLNSAGTPLLVVDNAQWVDAASCAVLEQLAASATVKMLVLSRPGPSNMASSAIFTDDTMFAQCQLPMLTQDEVLAEMEEILDGTVVPGSAAVFRQQSGGHPLFLRALLGSTLAQGTFARHGRVWALSSSWSDPHPDVSDVAIDVFEEFSEREREVLEIVALAGPLHEALLHRVLPGATFGTLLDANVLRISRGRDPTVGFEVPVFGECLRQRIPVGRSIDIRQRVLRARAYQPLSSCALMRHTAWSFDCGAVVSDRSLLHAARIANGQNDPQLAIRLAAGVVDSQHVFSARMVRIQAHIMLEQYAPAREQLDQLNSMSDSQSECDSLGALTLMLESAEGYQTARLRQLQTRWRMGYRELQISRCAGADLIDALILVKSGRQLDKAMRMGLQDVAATENHMGLQFASTVLLAQSKVSSGDHLGAQSDFLKARALVRRHPGQLGIFDQVLTAQQMLFLASVGDSVGAFELWHDVEEATSPELNATRFHGVADLIAAMSRLDQGLVVSAAATFDIAIAALRENDPAGVLSFALAVATYANYLAGNSSRAVVTAEAFHASTSNDRSTACLLSEAYVAAAGTGGESAQEIQALLLELADDAHSHGGAAIEMAICNLLFRSGSSEVLARMATIELKTFGPALSMMQAMARALVNEDATGMERVAIMPGAQNNKLLAAEALGRALQLHAKQGRQESRHGVLAQLRTMNVPFEATGSHIIRELASSAELTVREKEIAALVHRRYSNRDIAEKFTLSQRTIEGHLYRIYSKLGIGSREELYEPWLTDLLTGMDK